MRGSSFRQWRPGGGLPALACVAAALLILPVQNRMHARFGSQGPPSDILYFGSPGVVKKMALGYDSLLADIYWIRAIQYYGRFDQAARRPVRYRNLGPLLDIASILDPAMIEVYRAGSIFLAEPDPIGAGQPEEALRLLDKGIRCHPADWRLFLDKGFVYFWYLHDYARAGEAWLRGSRLETAPPWMEGLAAAGFSRGGELATAKLIWKQQAEHSGRSEVRENARNHLASIEVSETLWTMEFVIEKYRETTGSYPGELQDLVRAGLLRSVPVDPSGVPYAYEPSNGNIRLGADSRVRYLSVPAAFRDSHLEKLEQWAAGQSISEMPNASREEARQKR